MIELVAVGDFNCPFSAVASGRAAVLEQRGDASFDWRAIEHDTAIPRRGHAVAGPLADGMRAELDQILGLLLPGEPDRTSAVIFLG